MEYAVNTYTYPDIGDFQANWTVPSAPTSNNGQLLYLWNGLQPYSCPIVIQSVLQWGVAHLTGGVNLGGAYWQIESWYVVSSTNYLYSSPIRVSVGDHITGVQDGYNCSSGSCDWLIFTSDTSIPATTSLSCGGVSQVCGLTEQNAYIALESTVPSGSSYCNEYPASSPTTFVSKEVGTTGVGISPSWSTYSTSGTGCSMSVSTSGGTVKLYY